MVTTTVSQARGEFADLLNRVVYGNERVVLTRHGTPIVAFIPINSLAMLEKIENLLDSEKALERLAEIEQSGSLSLEEVKASLGK